MELMSLCASVKYAWSVALIFMNLFKIYVYARINDNKAITLITECWWSPQLFCSSCCCGRRADWVSRANRKVEFSFSMKVPKENEKFINIFRDYLTTGENMKCHTLLPFSLLRIFDITICFLLAFLERRTRKKRNVFSQHHKLNLRWGHGKCKFKIQIQFQMKYHFWY